MLSKEWSKLSKIGSEGRSTATTVLSYENITKMKDAGVVSVDRKLMTFVDARQDAALQAGHFNDFIRIGKIRSAIWNAVKDSDEPIGSDWYSDILIYLMRTISVTQIGAVVVLRRWKVSWRNIWALSSMMI